MEQPDRPQMKMRRMRIACWIPKATNAHSEYIVLITFSWQHWLYERALMRPEGRMDRHDKGKRKIFYPLHRYARNYCCWV